MQDLRLALRSLRQTPLVTAVAILSLALGIGANTAIFSLINALLMRPLPVSAPDRLAVVSDSRGVNEGFLETWPFTVVEQVRVHADLFDGVCAWWHQRLNLARGGGEQQPVDAVWVSGDYFSTLGVPPLLGRTIGARDDVPGAGLVVVISYGFWQRRFAGAADAIGSALYVEGLPFTIIGVTPPNFFGAEVGRSFDVAMPLNAEAVVRGADSRLVNRQRPISALTLLIRLQAGQSIETATVLLRGIQPQVRAAAVPPNYPAAFRSQFLKDPFVAVAAATGTSGLRGRYKRPLILMLVIVALVLAIACANIANLQLARGTARRHELAVRLALGASRWRLLRAWLFESLVVAGAGVIAGGALATWSSRLIVSELSTVTNRVYVDLTLDWRVAAFTLIVAVLTTVLFGVLPALRATRVTPGDALKEQGRASVGVDRMRLSNSLVVSQVALSVVIVVAVGLFVRTFQKLATVPLGFESGRVLLVNVKASRSSINATDRIAFVQRVTARIGQLPGVATAAASALTPIGGMGMITMVRVAGTPTADDPGAGERLGPHSAYVNFVSPGWFATYGTPITAGRDFTERDGANAPRVIVVNAAFVHKFLPGPNPIGATASFQQRDGTFVQKTIVGIVPDAAYFSVRITDEAEEYAPIAQMDFGLPPMSDGVISVRAATGSPMLLARGIAGVLTAEDPDLVFGFRMLAEQVGASLTQERLVAMLSGFLSVLALLLAGLGLYGITAYGVARRRSEIAIRMALGSTSADVSRAVVLRAVSLAGIGVAVGVIASLWASKFVGALLFGLNGRDPHTLVGTVAILVGVATVASCVPASRAAHIDPAEVLRES
jgi:predicted permease